jgi:hypothetical protein
MKIKLTYSMHEGTGVLYLERTGKMRPQFCKSSPFWPDGTPRSCGDWCPHFGEPVIGSFIPSHIGEDGNHFSDYKDVDTLTICKDRVLFGKIIDERKRP